MKVLFVCLGNICRSPLAEGVFRHLVNSEGLSGAIEIDSCGTGSWHVGEPPHRGSQKIAKQNGISLQGQTARQIEVSDLDEFDWVVAMDSENLRDIQSLTSNYSAKLCCLREFDPEKGDLDVPDPYYSGGFDHVFDIVERCCQSLLEEVKKEL